MSSETITAIREYRTPDEDEWSFDREEGYEIETTDQKILLVIDAYQSCCESWGYFLTEDDTAKFIGAELRGIAVTDTDRSTKQIRRYDWDEPTPEGAIDLYDGGAMFVDIETDRGVLQFVAYNAHNGYYGHTARVSAKQLEHQEVV